MSLETTITADVKKVEAEFDKLVDKIKALFEGHPNVDAAVSNINEAKDAATIPTPTTQNAELPVTVLPGSWLYPLFGFSPNLGEVL